MTPWTVLRAILVKHLPGAAYPEVTIPRTHSLPAETSWGQCSQKCIVPVPAAVHLAHPPRPLPGKPEGQQTRCMCCCGQQPNAESTGVENWSVCTLAVLVQSHWVFGACRWCYLIVKMTPPPHHNRPQVLLCKSSTGTTELEPLKGATQAQGWIAQWATGAVNHPSLWQCSSSSHSLKETVRHCHILEALRWGFGCPPGCLQICTLNPEVLHYW